MRRGPAAARQAVSARKWLTLAALLAFLLQGLAVQTHVHGVGNTTAHGVAYKPPARAPLKSQDLNDQCRLCQELVHAGIFIAPSVMALHASQVFTLALPAAPPLSARFLAAGFAWQSRAPPR